MRDGIMCSAWLVTAACATAPLLPVATAPWLALEPPRESASIDGLRLNQIQAIGTHNSYHQRPAVEALALFDKRATKWNYSHRPLDQQLDLGVRQIELDIWSDPKGGVFANNGSIAGRLRSDDPSLMQPGFKVLHVPDVDARSCCPTLAGCLQSVRCWSLANPRHEPIMILIELKHEGVADPLGVGLVVPSQIDAIALDALDAEIASVFPPEGIITPDDVRGDATSLAAAIAPAAEQPAAAREVSAVAREVPAAAHGWPTIAASRGKVLLLIHGDNAHLYAKGHESLRGRQAFLDAARGTPERAMQVINNPVGEAKEIRAALDAGCIVRTRADADIEEVGTGGAARRDAALASGAQFVSTDVPEVRPELDPQYVVRLPGGIAMRPNPVTAPRLVPSPAEPSGKAPKPAASPSP